MKINKNTIITNTFKMSKKVIDVYKKYNLYCAGCKGAEQDSVEMVANNNGLDLIEFLKDLNNAADNA